MSNDEEEIQWADTPQKAGPERSTGLSVYGVTYSVFPNGLTVAQERLTGWDEPAAPRKYINGESKRPSKKSRRAIYFTRLNLFDD